MSKVPTRGTQIILGIQSGMSLPNKTKSNKLHGHEDVDMAGAWDEGYASYRGRPHGRVETEYEAWLKKICREESAEAIVQRCPRHRRKG